MKILIVFCCFVALTCAEIAASNKYSTLHHSEHEQSVNKAKQSLQERLSLLEGQGQGGYQQRYGNAYGSSGSEKYVAATGCASCIGGSESYSSRLSSQRGSSANYGVGTDYEGVGIVGHTTDVVDDDDVQSVVSPYSSGTASRYSSAKAFEAEELQQRVVPADLSSISSNAYRSSLSEHDEDDLQRSVGSGYGGTASSRLYNQRVASESSRVGAAAVPVYVSGSQRSHSSSQRESQSELSETQKPIPAGQYVSISARPGQSTVLAVPVRVIHTQGIPEDSGNYYSRTAEQRASEQSASSTRVQSPTSTTYRVTYSPARNSVSSDRIASSTSEFENSRSVQQPEKFVGYNSFNIPESSSQTRFRADESDSHAEQSSQVRVAPVTVSYPSNGGSSRFASTGSSGSYNQVRVAPAFPVNTIESSSSLRTAEEKAQRRYTPASPTYVSASRLASEQEERNQQASTSYGSTGTYYAPVTTQTRLHSGSGAQTQYQRQGYAGFSPYVATGNQLSSSHGAASDKISTQRFGLGTASTDDLNVYMSESERLARLQQSQISGSSGSSAAGSNYEANARTLQTASNLDSAAANFVRTSNLASRNSDYDTANVDASGTGTGGAGGYNRVRSWNKQSKWSSGSEYGSDGKPKTYSTLSTGEGEKYNINGAETGYKAATTTLENDGKVSTYSIHTP